MLFRLLGHAQVETACGSVGVESAPVRGVLAALLLEEGRSVPVERLLHLLWEDPPGSARKDLRLHIARLRAQLGKLGLRDRLVTLRGGGGEGGYRLVARGEEVDAVVFRRLASQGLAELRAGAADAAETSLTTALSLWQGPIGQDCTASQRLKARFTAFDELHLTVRERLVEARLALGRTIDLIPEIQEILATAPFREASWAHLMRAYYLGGDAAGAIDAWERAGATLGERLGLDPSAQLRRLHLSILRRDCDAVRGPSPRPGERPTPAGTRSAAGYAR
ncbi:AfsR/SARP family transcriptional regulator [Thermopolyspora sp. NPDC052614]|uniref:AfsR/SARP family transcriptional regulator n=1 Tax=Thermopolyspora sp. NPDC052614 TaxID=3155682 RepID=UPI0034489E0B